MRAGTGSLGHSPKESIENWKGLVRRPQSKDSHTLAWLGDELGEGKRLRAQWGTNPDCPGKVKRASMGGSFVGERLIRQPGKMDSCLIPD